MKNLQGIPTKVLMIVQKRRCYICNKFMCGKVRKKGYNKQKFKYRKATRDHVFPKSLGGKGHGNIVLAHAECNSRRGNALLPDNLSVKALYIRLAAIAYILSD